MKIRKIIRAHFYYLQQQQQRNWISASIFQTIQTETLFRVELLCAGWFFLHFLSSSIYLSTYLIALPPRLTPLTYSLTHLFIFYHSFISSHFSAPSLSLSLSLSFCVCSSFCACIATKKMTRRKHNTTLVNSNIIHEFYMDLRSLTMHKIWRRFV